MRPLDQKSRLPLAVAAAFLCPGLFLFLISAVFDPAALNPGNVEVGAGFVMSTFLVAALIMPLFGSPFVLSALLVWAALHRLRFVWAWVAALIGAATGVVAVLLLAPGDAFPWKDAAMYGAAGLLTGLTVWLLAYGRRPSAFHPKRTAGQP